MIDFTRAFVLAWERTIIILFRPFDASKWCILGFNAFLVMLGEGSIQFNRPITFTPRQQVVWNSQTLPGVIHDSKQWVESLRALAEGSSLVWYLFLIVAYIMGWLVLNWVGCRGQFLFIDNIVRNRAAIAEPWRRYAHQGNVWFLFQLGLTIFTYLLMTLSAGLFLLISWAWISQERNPQGGEVAALVLFFLGFLVFWCVVGALLFILRSLVVLLLFRQTFGLGSALGEVIHLLFSQPISMLGYVVASFLLAIAGAIVTVTAIGLTCCCLCWLAFWLGLVPIVGSLLMTAIVAQLLLPLLIYYRCFQIECLSQFGPPYDIWRVDVPPAAAPAP